MYYIYFGKFGPSLLIESTGSTIINKVEVSFLDKQHDYPWIQSGMPEPAVKKKANFLILFHYQG